MILRKKRLIVFLCIVILLFAHDIARKSREAALEKQLFQEAPFLFEMLNRARDGEEERTLLEKIQQNGLDDFSALLFYPGWDGLYLSKRNWGILGKKGYLITSDKSFSVPQGYSAAAEEVWQTETLSLYRISFYFD